MLTKQILVFIKFIFSSAYIQKSKYFGYNNVWVHNEIFATIWSFKSYSCFIKASTQLVTLSLYIIMKLNWDKMSA